MSRYWTPMSIHVVVSSSQRRPKRKPLDQEWRWVAGAILSVLLVIAAARALPVWIPPWVQL